MKKVLVIYYSQSGQLKSIIENVTSSLYKDENIKLDIEVLKPQPDYPFPWKDEFFDSFAESVKGIPCELAPFSINPETKYDLVILGIQTWYISPSVPVTAFLKSASAKQILNNTPIITVHGSRNMWVSSQEIIKKHLHTLNSKLVANIALADKSENYISAITIIRWLVHGNKGPYKLLPMAGVREKDIEHSKVFSPIIKDALENNNFDNLHQDLLKQNSVFIRFNIMNIEFTARKIFVKFANYVDKKPTGTSARKKRINHFKYYLLFVLFVLSPVVSIIYSLLRILLFPLANKQLAYYKGIKLK